MRVQRLIITLIFLFISLSSSYLFSQTGWIWQNPLPQGNTFSTVKFLTPTKIICGGWYSTILKSENGGLNWQRIYINAESNINCSYFLDSLHGYVAGSLVTNSAALIFYTSDGGCNWINKCYPVYSNITKIQFINQNTGYVLSEAVYKTTNGGDNWTLSGPVDAWYNFCFPVPDTGYITGVAQIRKTTNAGINWFDLTAPSGIGFITTLYFINSNTGYISSSSDNKLYKTNDGGLNWETTVLNVSTRLEFISFLNNNTGYCCGSGGEIFKTTNQGYNWTLLPVFSSIYKYYSLSIFDSLNIIAVGESGEIIKSTNGGNNWFSYYYTITVKDLLSVDFLNLNTGYAVGGSGTILKTTNGGDNWIFLSSPALATLRKVFFINTSTGYACSDAGGIFNTTNAGLNWVQQSSGTSANMKSIQFTNENTGYAVGVLSSFPSLLCPVLKTTTGGGMWSMICNLNPDLPSSLFFINSNTGYVVCYDGEIYKTTNGWGFFSLNSGTTGSLTCVNFINPDTGIVAGSNIILKTTNGGINWIQKTNPLGAVYSDIKYFDNNNIYISTDHGKIIKSSDGGENWLIQKTETYGAIGGISFINLLTGYLVGVGGIIQKTTNGGTNVSVKNIENLIPNGFILHQNYPNPFNPSTKIRFEIPAHLSFPNASTGNPYVSLKIYDITGREINTLVNEQLQPGIYEVTFDGSNLPSGIYFYCLISDKFSVTKKMILLK